ncbi:hypothetical protein GA0061094_4399 [[Bacillus] enclensis]|uniref:Uncharacterized protein n=1 Tax=[Bacillus] enclensis TaxID=1402860 RepID=A0A1C4E1B7_9BACI|nr:hypothetical protein GA0061094_4399 [[Bacillus] enclensis]
MFLLKTCPFCININKLRIRLVARSKILSKIDFLLSKSTNVLSEIELLLSKQKILFSNALRYYRLRLLISANLHLLSKPKLRLYQESKYITPPLISNMPTGRSTPYPPPTISYNTPTFHTGKPYPPSNQVPTQPLKHHPLTPHIPKTYTIPGSIKHPSQSQTTSILYV